MTLYRNPFQNDPDRAQIWDMLVERDIEAYLAADWGMVADDFLAGEFFGIDGAKAHDPDKWSVRFPSLAAYRDRWVSDALAGKDAADIDTARSGIVAATTLEQIEIDGDRATAHKKFDGNVQLKDGSLDRLYWQTLYVCRRVGGRWKIASFLGYIPFDLGIRQ